MNTEVTTQIKVHQCSQCQGDVEFFCSPCRQNLCIGCKEKHVVNLDTKDHDVVVYRLKHGNFMAPESCERHPDCIYENWCQSCECPICIQCDKHKRHEILDIKSAYKVQRQRHTGRIIHIRGESLPQNRAILAGLKSDVKIDVTTCQAKFSSIQAKMTVKAKKLKNLIDIHRKALKDLNKKDIYMKYILIHHKIQEFVHRYEQLANRPIQFLLFVKKTPVPKTIDIPDTITFNFCEEINIGYMNEILGEIKVTEEGKRQIKNERMLELMPRAMLQKYVVLPELNHGIHISFVTTDRIWVSDGQNLILTNSRGNFLHHMSDVNKYYGVHTVNSAGELIYVDRDWNINILRTDNVTKSMLIKRTELWEPWCVCYSRSTGGLLVMMRDDTSKPTMKLEEVKLIRYNGKAQPVQTIQYHSSGKKLYSEPVYISENHNGDIIVSDGWLGLVVTDSKGKYRFTYTGPPILLAFGPLMPHGTCVDALLNILICSRLDHTVQMIDKDGQLLSILYLKQEGITAPLGLSYDEKNHLLWIGSENSNRLCVCRYLRRQDFLAD